VGSYAARLGKVLQVQGPQRQCSTAGDFLGLPKIVILFKTFMYNMFLKIILSFS
jgi:hypothetical protein